MLNKLKFVASLSLVLLAAAVLTGPVGAVAVAAEEPVAWPSVSQVFLADSCDDTHWCGAK